MDLLFSLLDEECVDVNLKSKHGESLIELIILNGRLDVLKTLLEKKPETNVTLKGSHGLSPLSQAIAGLVAPDLESTF